MLANRGILEHRRCATGGRVGGTTRCTNGTLSLQDQLKERLKGQGTSKLGLLLHFAFASSAFTFLCGYKHIRQGRTVHPPPKVLAT